MKKNNKGFSLVELIIVIAIMAVLIGLLAPQYLKFVQKSKRSSDLSNAQTIASAFNIAFADGTIKDTDDVASATHKTTPAATDAAGKAGLQVWPEIKATNDTTWSVDIDSNGVSAVKIGTVKVWPTVDAGSEWAK